MRCPLCKGPAADGNPDWPFCSERCRLLDLDNWLSSRYRVASPMDPVEKSPPAYEAGEAVKGERG